MFKVSFKGDFKKVETFNDKTIVVTLVGILTYPNEIWNITNSDIINWMGQNPNMDIKFLSPKENMIFRIEFSGKSVCTEGDTFDEVIGERIAESKAKIKLYKFMTTLCSKIMNDLYVKMYGNAEVIRVNENHNESPKDCIQLAYIKYKNLWSREIQHLNDLLNQS